MSIALLLAATHLVATHSVLHQQLHFCFVLPHVFHLQWLQVQFGGLRQNEQLDIGAKWLYCCLLDLFRERCPEWKCGKAAQMTLTLEQLARESGLPHESVKPALDSLAEEGYLEMIAERTDSCTWRIILRE